MTPLPPWRPGFWLSAEGGVAQSSCTEQPFFPFNSEEIRVKTHQHLRFGVLGNGLLPVSLGIVSLTAYLQGSWLQFQKVTRWQMFTSRKREALKKKKEKKWPLNHLTLLTRTRRASYLCKMKMQAHCSKNKEKLSLVAQRSLKPFLFVHRLLLIFPGCFFISYLLSFQGVKN